MNENPLDQLGNDAEWPFPHIPPDVYWSLPEADRIGLEQVIRDMIEKTNSKH